jgi:hypothetical protein
MKTNGLGKPWRFGIGAAIILGTAGVWATAFFGAQPAAWDAKRIESFLTRATVVKIEKDTESGRTMPWRVTLRDGKTEAWGFFKYIHRPLPAAVRHSYRYELAAYALSRLLELEIVPPVIERTIDKTPGSLQWYVEGCQSERDRERTNQKPPDLDAFLRQLDVIQVFEALVNDECGDKDDTLIHKDTWKVCRIDFSGAFAPSGSIAAGCSLQRCSKNLFNHLERLTRSDLIIYLEPYLGKNEIDALFERKQRIIEHFKTQIQKKGEAVVLFSDRAPATGQRPS